MVLVIETLAPGDRDSLLQEARKARKFVENLIKQSLYAPVRMPPGSAKWGCR